MDLNKHALEGLQIAGDPVTIPDTLFKELLNCVFEILLQRESDPDRYLGSAPDKDLTSLKSAYYGLSTLVVEIAKSNVEESIISSLLEEVRWTSDRVEDFLLLVSSNRRDLQVILARLDSTYPHIVDADWRLDYCIKSNHLEKINKSTYFISLKTQEPGGKQGSVNFACTTEQLQDLVGKLRDATKSVEKASGK